MKNRNIKHRDDWATPPFFYEKLNSEFNFNFDPCPFMHDIKVFDGLKIDWKERNYINPPYSDLKATGYLKSSFVKKAIEESKKGKLCVMLLPVSTSTKLFHEHILPSISEPIRFIKGRIPFIGYRINKENNKTEYVNWHLWENQIPENCKLVKNSGQHDSMIVVFGKK